MAIEKMRELLNKANDLQHSSTGEYRKFNDYLREELYKIRNNKDYSESGKERLTDALKEKMMVRFMQGAREARKQYDAYLSEAKKMAKDLIYANTPEVDEEVARRFQRDFSDIKTAIMLSDPKKGKELLTEFLQSIDEPALAEVVKNDFAEVIQPILSGATGTEAVKYRSELFDAFEEVKKRSLDPDAFAAMKVADYADAALNGKFFSIAVEQVIEGHLGRTAKTYMHKPDAFFEKFPELDKPVSNQKTVEDHVAEEEAKN